MAPWCYSSRSKRRARFLPIIVALRPDPPPSAGACACSAASMIEPTVDDPGSTREVVELRFEAEGHETHGRTLADLAERVEVLPDRLLLYTDEGDATLDAVRSRGKSPIAALVRRSTLEDVFLHLTGRSLVD